MLLVPLYVYPSKTKLETWRLIADTARAGQAMKVIINPDNGPGKKQSSTYLLNVAELADSGADMLGYVSTQYGKRPIEDVKADIRRWREFYPQVEGFFFDEAASKPEKLGYYQEVINYARTYVRNQQIQDRVPLYSPYICINPGSVCDESYLSCADGADCVVIFESQYKSWIEKKPFPAWMARYSRDRFAIMVLKVGEVVGEEGNMTKETPALIESVTKKALKTAKVVYLNPVWEGRSSYPEISAPYLRKLVASLTPH